MLIAISQTPVLTFIFEKLETVRFIWVVVKAVIQTVVRTKRPQKDPSQEVVSVPNELWNG